MDTVLHHSGGDNKPRVHRDRRERESESVRVRETL